MLSFLFRKNHDKAGIALPAPKQVEIKRFRMAWFAETS
jgi:hypothetical protein